MSDKTSVRRRIASFEALMHANTSAIVSCEAAHVDHGSPLSELQLQPKGTSPPEQAKAHALGSSQSVSSPDSIMTFPLHHFGSPSDSSKQGSTPLKSSAPSQSCRHDGRPASRADAENVKPFVHSWQAGAGERQSAASPSNAAASQELEMVETASDHPSSQGEEAQTEYSEVQIRIRLPRFTADTGPGGEGRKCNMCGSSAEGSRSSSDGTIERLREELAAKERERRHTAEALQRKQSECENLSRVVRELAESRAQLVTCRAMQSERIEELQMECMRIMRIADLSRTVSKENITKATQAKKHARQADEEALQQKRAATIVRESNRTLRLEVLDLRERISLLERLPLLHHGGQSACMQEYAFMAMKETY